MCRRRGRRLRVDFACLPLPAASCWRRCWGVRPLLLLPVRHDALACRNNLGKVFGSDLRVQIALACVSRDTADTGTVGGTVGGNRAQHRRYPIPRPGVQERVLRIPQWTSSGPHRAKR